MYKQCSRCKKNKDISEFNKNKWEKDGFCHRCRQCVKEYNEENKEKIAEQRKNNRLYGNGKVIEGELQRKYNISLIQFNDMLNNQNNSCLICSKIFDDKNKPLVDHNHDTKKVRGLLCNKCNSAIGFFKENIITINNAIIYLQKHNKLDKQ